MRSNRRQPGCLVTILCLIIVIVLFRLMVEIHHQHSSVDESVGGNGVTSEETVFDTGEEIGTEF